MRYKKILLGLLFSLVVVPTFAQETTFDFSSLETTINEQLESQNVPGVSIAVVYNDEMIYSNGFGVRSMEGDDLVTADTLFHIGSTTKPLTTIGVLRLVEQGKLDLDTPIVNYLPNFTANDEITMRQLLSHTSGLSDAASEYGSRDSNALMNSMATFTDSAFFTKPGVVQSYSNPGFNIAGAVIETVSGQPFWDYMAQEVFNPMGMERTTFDPYRAMTYPLAVGHASGFLSMDVVRPMSDAIAESPSGILYSSATDLTQLIKFYLNDGVVNDEAVVNSDLFNAMITPATAEVGEIWYGLGTIISDNNGVRIWGHDGAINGYNAFLTTLPDYETGIVILANSNFDAQPVVDAVFSTLNISLPEPATTANPEANNLEDFIGRYVIKNLDGTVFIDVEITLDGDSITAQATGQPPFELRAFDVDTFELIAMGSVLGEIEFLRDSEGVIQFFNLGGRIAVREN
jgi:CubicO group peptidase (beta-lactamase class C family)